MGNIGFKTISVSGLEGALHGMRAPMQSYHLSDSDFSNDIIGEKDMDLALRLIKGGSEHSKFRRMIHVQVEVAMPRYWWSEADTYKVSTAANSESTMHKLLNNNNPITEEQFFFGNDENSIPYIITKKTLEETIEALEGLRQLYKGIEECPENVSKIDLLVIAKRILPECFIQVRTWDLNYETIANIYNQRVKHPHRLKEEWVETFGQWVESLPYAKELIIGE